MPALALTHRAKKCGSAALHHPLDGTVAVAPWAGFALAVMAAEIGVEIAGLAAGAGVIAQRRAACRDRLGEHGLDGIDQRLRALVRCAGLARDGRGAALGREARAMQRLADVYIAEPGHHRLVLPRRLQ